MAENLTESSARRRIGRLLQGAAAGEEDYAWLDALARRAGYLPARYVGRMTADEQGGVLHALRQKTAARLVGKSPRRFRDSSAPRNSDGTYDAMALWAWRLEGERQRLEVDADLVGDGAPSPGLERYRLERARGERRKNLEAEGRLVHVAAVQEEYGILNRAINESLRRGADRLDQEGKKQLYDAWDEVQRDVCEALDLLDRSVLTVPAEDALLSRDPPSEDAPDAREAR